MEQQEDFYAEGDTTNSGVHVEMAKGREGSHSIMALGH